jgi:hypothetical protein
MIDAQSTGQLAGAFVVATETFWVIAGQAHDDFDGDGGDFGKGLQGLFEPGLVVFALDAGQDGGVEGLQADADIGVADPLQERQVVGADGRGVDFADQAAPRQEAGGVGGGAQVLKRTVVEVQAGVGQMRAMERNSVAMLSMSRTRLGDSSVPHSQKEQVKGQPR